MGINKIHKKPVGALKKDVLSGFLLEDTQSSSQTSLSQSNELNSQENDKDILNLLKNTIKNVKDEIKDSKTKQDEMAKVLSVTKDSLKRNYLSKQLQDKKNEMTKKNSLLKSQEEELKKQEEEKRKKTLQNTTKVEKETPGESISLNMSLTENVLRKKINEMIQNNFKKKKKMTPKMSQPAPAPQPEMEQPKKNFKVTFDKSSGSPWKVLFSERGFLVGNTRLSFEDIETAINKNYNISLEAGEGLVLDQIKLNKILKYKNRF